MTIGDGFPEVIASAKRGDKRALELIYRDVAPLVLGYLRANGARDPEDVAGDVFVALVTSVRSFGGDERQFRSWLLTITHRRLIDSFRRAGRHPEDAVDVDDLGKRVVSLTDTESEAMNRLRSLGVLDAMNQLTDDQRAVLMLRVLADLPVRDIARIVGKPETAVKALLRRAMASLERLLQPQATEGTA